MRDLLHRDCPRDRTRLQGHEAKGGIRSVTVDLCATCNGLFLDGGELARVVPDRAVASYFTRLLGSTPSSPLVCPGCGGLMRAKGPEGSDLVVDVCESCSGVWLDGGELERLAKLQRTEVPDDTREARIDRLARKGGGSGGADPPPVFVVGGLAGLLYALTRRRVGSSPRRPLGAA